MGWPLEQCAYWLDGALRLGFILHDEALIRKIRARLDPVVDGVHKADFGTSLIYWKKGYKPEEFNGWAHSQLGRALVALYLGTGDKRVLDALVKVYADYPATMGKVPLAHCRVTGLCNLDAMLETYSLERRPADPRPRAGGHGPARRRPRHWRLGPRTIAAGPHGGHLRGHPSARPGLSLVGRSAAVAGHLGRSEMAGRQPHAPLRRGLRRGVRLRNRRLPQDRNVQRDRHAPDHVVDLPHPRRRRLGRSHGAGLFQRRCRPQSPATSRPCATTSRPTASAPIRCPANSRTVPARRAPASTNSAVPRSCAASAPSTASFPTT